jgi:uncharacterized protein YjiS (DUF1127 family)
MRIPNPSLKNSRLLRDREVTTFEQASSGGTLSMLTAEVRRFHMVAIHLHQPRNRARRHDATHILSDAGRHAVATLREWRRRARDRAELAALDDHTLADIGITRAHAEFLANKPFWRE